MNIDCGDNLIREGYKREIEHDLQKLMLSAINPDIFWLFEGLQTMWKQHWKYYVIAAVTKGHLCI